MRIGYHEYANEADDDDHIPKPAQSLGTPVPRQKIMNKQLRMSKLEIDAIKGGSRESD